MLVHTRVVRIEWGDCDPAGIIFYPRYFAIFDASTSALIERALGMPKSEYLKAYEFAGHPLVNTHSRFHIPTRFGDDVTDRDDGCGDSTFELRSGPSPHQERCARGRSL